uniref:Uncharacterized protein n=1 Tax=Vitis vinifera TaxID=29760 RepID=F6HDM8_VITVI
MWKCLRFLNAVLVSLPILHLLLPPCQMGEIRT